MDFSKLVKSLIKDTDYTIDEKTKSVLLSEEGKVFYPFALQ